MASPLEGKTDEGQRGGPVSVDSTRVGAAGSVGDRYRLLECVAGDPDGPAVAWRAWDDLLNRPVTLTVVRPGGPAAGGFLAHAHAVSAVTHPSLARVWDAVDEGDRAYVVSEWVTGTPFTALLRDGALDADSAAGTVARVADGVAAAHGAGVAFGGVHPDHVVVTGNGEVKLAQVVGDGRAAASDDVRGLGALLYGALTAHWPLAPTGGAATLRPATTSSGHLLSPRQVRAGVPEDLSSLAVRALDPTGPQGVRSAAAMAGVLADRAGPSDDVFALDDSRPRRKRRWLALGVPVSAGLVLLALLGWVVGTALGGLPGIDGGNSTAGASGPTRSSSPPTAAALQPVRAQAARLYDPPGDGSEAEGIPDAADGDPTTSWRTDRYNSRSNSTFGGLKQGIGIAYDFGSPTALKQVTVTTDRPGIQVQIRAGDSADATDPDSYRVVGATEQLQKSGTYRIKSGTSARYYIVWLTQLTADANGKYSGSVSEVTFAR